MSIITAEEARKIVQTSGKLFEETKQEISNAITHVAQSGAVRVSCSAPIGVHFMIIDFFKQQGFKVSQNDGCNPTYLSFDWSE